MLLDKNKTTLILGAYGRVGTPLVDLMDKAGYKIIFPTSNMCNMLDRYSYELYFDTVKPTYVINLCAKQTNINLCNHYPASICRDTLNMNMAVLDMCKKHEVEKLVNVICSCSYSPDKDVLRESEFWEGSPHESIIAHGLAKRMVYFLGQSYAKQFHMNVVTIALNNLFGGCKWDNPASLKFLDSMITKIVEARVEKFKTVYLWGSGKPRREVLFTRDAAEGVLRTFESYNNTELINVGTGEDKSIAEWADLIADVVGWKGEFIYETGKPDGQMKKLFSIEKMQTSLNWKPQTDIREAIKMCADEYKEFFKNKIKKSYRLQ